MLSEGLQINVIRTAVTHTWSQIKDSCDSYLAPDRTRVHQLLTVLVSQIIGQNKFTNKIR